jgi:hypothetical protein
MLKIRKEYTISARSRVEIEQIRFRTNLFLSIDVNKALVLKCVLCGLSIALFSTDLCLDSGVIYILSRT